MSEDESPVADDELDSSEPMSEENLVVVDDWFFR